MAPGGMAYTNDNDTTSTIPNSRSGSVYTIRAYSHSYPSYRSRIHYGSLYSAREIQKACKRRFQAMLRHHMGEEKIEWRPQGKPKNIEFRQARWFPPICHTRAVPRQYKWRNENL